MSETTLTVAEGGSATYTVVLDVQPTSDVVIGVTKTGSTDVTRTPTVTSGNQTTLTFTTSNWSTAQTVTVAAAQDADAVDDAASITHAVVASRSADEFDAVNIAGVAVAVTDDETAGVSVSETALTVAEGGSGSYTVRLNTQPTSNVVISVTRTGSTDVTLDTDTGTSGNQTTLTFTTANWEHGADGDGGCRPGRRRGERRGLHRPRRRRRPQRQRVRQRDDRLVCRDRHRRRYRRGDGVRNHADGGRGRQRPPTR